MDKVKGIRTDTRTPQPYACVCGTIIAHKGKSLKKHLLTKTHLELAPCPPHHWVIESANGPLSSGFCQNCNEQRKFENSIAQFTWTGRAAKEYEDEEKEKEQQEELKHLVT